jgi:NAD(P) transhydrogenase
MSNHFDLIVLGGGPAGTSGAASAGFLGKRVALVERLPVLGGAGINTGTIPSKTLRETALVLSGLRSRQLYGVDLSLRGEATVADFGRHARHVTDAERDRSIERLDLRGVTRFQGVASFADPHTVRVVADDGGETLLRATGY